MHGPRRGRARLRPPGTADSHRDTARTRRLTGPAARARPSNPARMPPAGPPRPARRATSPQPNHHTQGVTMTARVTGKNVLVTGGGTGIGLAFAHENATVAVAGCSAEPLTKTVKLIQASGGRAMAITADITRSEDLAKFMTDSAAAHGSLDIAVNSAGTLTAFGPVSDIDEDQWSTLVSVNLTGTLLSMKHKIAHMRRHGGGAIVNIASCLGAHMRLACLGGYVATKAAVTALTRNAALDHISNGVRINAVSPGPVDTPMSYHPGESRADRDARKQQQLPGRPRSRPRRDRRRGALPGLTRSRLHHRHRPAHRRRSHRLTCEWPRLCARQHPGRSWRS